MHSVAMCGMDFPLAKKSVTHCMALSTFHHSDHGPLNFQFWVLATTRRIQKKPFDQLQEENAQGSWALLWPVDKTQTAA